MDLRIQIWFVVFLSFLFYEVGVQITLKKSKKQKLIAINKNNILKSKGGDDKYSFLIDLETMTIFQPSETMLTETITAMLPLCNVKYNKILLDIQAEAQNYYEDKALHRLEKHFGNDEEFVRYTEIWNHIKEYDDIDVVEQEKENLINRQIDMFIKKYQKREIYVFIVFLYMMGVSLIGLSITAILPAIDSYNKLFGG